MKTNEKEWKTDVDEMGVASLDPYDKWEISFYKLPLKFPVQNTGGYGIKREFKLETVYGGKLAFSLQVPFYDDRGWGNDNFIYLFDPPNGQWSRVTFNKERTAFDTGLIDPAHLEEEKNEKSLGFGELIVWTDDSGELQVIRDNTPYHLDDWEFDHRVLQAMDTREKAKTRQMSYLLETSKISNFLWVCDEKAYQSPEEADQDPPLFKLYDMRSLIKSKDKRLLRGRISDLIPFSAIRLDYNDKYYLVLPVRTFLEVQEDTEREMVDSIIVLSLPET